MAVPPPVIAFLRLSSRLQVGFVLPAYRPVSSSPTTGRSRTPRLQVGIVLPDYRSVSYSRLQVGFVLPPTGRSRPPDYRSVSSSALARGATVAPSMLL